MKKKTTIGLAFGVLWILSIICSPSAFAVASDSYNGISYIFLPPGDSNIGYVVRLKHTDTTGVTLPQKEIYIGLDSTYSGLAVSQERNIFMVRAPNIGPNEGWSAAPVGYLPNASDYSLDSDIYIRLIPPQSCNPWIKVHKTQYWKQNYTINGTKYSWAMVAGGPASVKYLDPAGTGVLGTPLWDGSTGIQHPTEPEKWLLPSHWAGMAYYAYGTSNHPNYKWKQLDGREDPPGSGIYRPKVLATEVPTYHGSDNQKFSCIVKRVYQIRDRSVQLVKGSDNPITPMAAESGPMLTATDIKATEYYARACGDNCIPGGSGPGAAVDASLATVQVVTSTMGRRYGFNPKAKMGGPYTDIKQAALRVASPDGTEKTIDVANTDGTIHANIANAAYLNNHGIKAARIKSVGVSSKFDPNAKIDFIYCSPADLIAVQDSWWGIGGIAYEYYKDDGSVYKLDYTGTGNPPQEYVGTLLGDIDDIGVDGDGYLYVMTTEADITDADVIGLNPPLTTITSSASFSIAPTGNRWYRPVITLEGPQEPIIVEDKDKKPGDYRHITYYQSFSKKVNRYPPAASGSLPLPEFVGQVSGYYKDLWSRRLEWNGTTAALIGNWSQEPKASRDSLIDGELAVINVAKVPKVFNENPMGPHVCRQDRQKLSETLVVEDTPVTFKVEGYKPFIDGERRNLKYMGSFGTYQNVRINYVPNGNGDYNHDEDGDGSQSGFPTDLFEADGFETVITWNATLVDGNTPDSPIVAQVAVASPSNVAPSFGGKSCDWTFTPPQPGNYAISANITYNYFNFSGAKRPSELTSGQRTVTTTKSLLSVISNPSHNPPPSLISEIALKPPRGSAGPDSAFQECAKPEDTASMGYDLPEDESPQNLSITFKAQFIRDFNRNLTSGKLTTYDGIGVWDYDAYYDIYANAGETPNYTKTGNHVPNYDPSTGSFTPSVYHPGVPIAARPEAANYGTRIDTPPTTNDLKFLRWNLWLENTCPGATVPPDPNSPSWRGVKIASGDCSTASAPVPTGNPSEYLITLSIPSSSIEAIRTPIDPAQYRLRLELIYPRASWYESTLGENRQQYRSLIPAVPPVCAVCEKQHPVIVTSVTPLDGTSAFSDTTVGGSWLLRVRDTTLPTFTNLSESVIQTTGDPVAAVPASFTLSDNNPCAEFGNFDISYQMPQNARNSDNLKIDVIQTTQSAPAPKPNYGDFWKDDNYRIAATYTGEIAEYGPDGRFAPGKDFENWVGTLYFCASGTVCDGYGTASKRLEHKFGALATSSDVISVSKQSLQRFDNDPPGFSIEIISQSDNRRWVASLSEGVRDLVSVASKPEDLAKCTLSISSFKLGDGSLISEANSSEVPGCTRYPTAIGSDFETVNAATLITDVNALPHVRRASRLLVNVDVIDNVDYKALASACFKLTETLEDGSTRNLLPAGVGNIPLAAAYLSDGEPNSQVRSPRARLVADMPLKVLPAGSQPQVHLEVMAEDAQGNTRTLKIPIYIIDSSFDARVLESKESRNN